MSRTPGRSSPPLAPPAQLTLRAHRTAPARVELVYNPKGGRLLRVVGWLVLCWGAIPFILWLPPHYPWVAGAFIAGGYLALRSWKGRFTIRSFAGICPRCGSPLSLGIDRTVDLPHTLTCFSCHFEPRLEVAFANGADGAPEQLPVHQDPDCAGEWRIRWLADEPFVFCEECRAGVPAAPVARARATRENGCAELLAQLTREGRPLI